MRSSISHSSSPRLISNNTPLNDANGTTVRLFMPSGPGVGGSRLPLMLYFHGGEYVLFHAAFEAFHNTCMALAATIPPEHRLLAAFEDTDDAVRRVRSYAAGSRGCRPLFLMGSHAGASIAFRAVDEGVELRGLILNPSSSSLSYRCCITSSSHH
uniref:Alpha/beta hydrolase fold-3 domain-containing protein n=1 Tax=Oryza meridionalis TaxID=40149 RepID=A0A0E0DQG3_9ORYZ